MKVIAHEAGRFSNSILVRLLREDGVIVAMYESWNKVKAQEFAERYILKGGDFFEWCSTPWKDQDYARGVTNYELNNFCEFLPKCK